MLTSGGQNARGWARSISGAASTPPSGLAVAGNRWDILAGIEPDPLPTVSIVVAYFEQPRQLARLLASIGAQDYPRELLEVIVVDDGSGTVPEVGAGVTLLRQENLGFRAAAARNLGARHARGDLLCFLDADTSPEPGYVRAITRLPALTPDALVVGRRRHADFDGAPQGAPLADDIPVEIAGPANELTEPAWLADEYERTGNLLRADARSYRFFIGAVLACSRTFFTEVGGFDETFTEYGGEDWEWANRAWLAGAVFAHEPSAVAWHDGPDWAMRAQWSLERQRAKNAESMRLAGLIAVPGSRGTGIRPGAADVIVHVSGNPAGSGENAALYVCVDSVLTAIPGATVVVDAADIRQVPWLANDSRIVAAAPRPGRARVEVVIPHPIVVEPAAFADTVRRVAEEHIASLTLIGERGAILLELHSSRGRRRNERWGRTDLFPVLREAASWCRRIDGEPDVESYLDRSAR